MRRVVYLLALLLGGCASLERQNEAVSEIVALQREVDRIDHRVSALERLRDDRAGRGLSKREDQR